MQLQKKLFGKAEELKKGSISGSALSILIICA